MTCTICSDRHKWHGSDHGRPGTHLHETGCHDGVMMDDDVHAEGWQRDVIYPPCPNNPARCTSCNGSGEAGPEVLDSDDCPACQGTGWADRKPQWPVSVDDLAVSIFRRMRKARDQGRGVRLSADELDLLAQASATQAAFLAPSPAPETRDDTRDGGVS